MVSFVRAKLIFGMNALKTNQILRSVGSLVTSVFFKLHGYYIFIKSRLYERSYNQTVSLELAVYLPAVAEKTSPFDVAFHKPRWANISLLVIFVFRSINFIHIARLSFVSDEWYTQVNIFYVQQGFV